MPKTPFSRTAIIRGRIDARRKLRVDRIFHRLGLTTTEALNLFYAQIEQRQGLPFEVALYREPTAETLASLREDVSKRPSFSTVEDLMRDLRSDDTN